MTGRTLDKLTRYDEADEHLKKAEEIASMNDVPDIRANALLGMAWLASVRGKRELCRELGTRAYEEAKRAGDRAILARAIMRMADFDEEGTHDSRLSYYHEAYRIYTELDDLAGLAITTLNMGNVAMAYRRTDDGERFYTESLQYYEELGNRWGIANCLGNLGNVAINRGDFQSSRDLHGKSMEISSSIGDMEGVVICNLNLGRDEHALGDHKKAYRHHSAALRLAVDLDILPLALGALFEMSRQLRNNGSWEMAGIALLCIMKFRGSFFEEGEDIDPDGDLRKVRANLTEGQFTRISTFASEATLEEIADRLLRETGP
jgi:tetratricopeptide (TPR) repeat protein